MITTNLPEPPLWLTTLTRVKNKELLKGKKGDIWVCGLDSSQPWCEKAQCAYCNRDCYYVPGNADLVKKKAKKICPICALEKHEKEIPKEFQDILRKVIEIAE